VNLQQKRIFHSAHGAGAVSFVEFQPGGSALLVSSGMSTNSLTREYTIKVWDMNNDEEDSLGLVAEKAAKYASQLPLPQLSNLDISRGFETVLRDAQLKVDIENGSPIQNALVRRQAFSHDGSLLLVFPGTAGRSVTVVTVDGFHERYQLVGHSDNVIWAEFSPDDRFIATSSWDTTVRIWSAVNGDLIRILRGANGQSWQGAFSPDGKLIAVGAGDNQVRIWNVESGELLHTLHGFAGWIRSLHFSPDGKVLAAGAAAGTLRVFDILTGESIQYWQAATKQHYMELTDVQYTIHGLLVFNSADGRQYTFDTRTNQKGLFENGQNPGKYAFGSSNSVVSSDGSLLFTVDSDRSVRVWRL